MSQLQTLSCYYTQISSLDISHLSLLNFINFGNEELISVNMKNGNNETPNFFPSPNLQFICADESEINFMQNRLNQNGNVNTVLNSYCSFSPGGNKNTITGNLLFDDNNNGCDANDNANPYLKVNISDGTNSGATFTNNTGNYTFYTQAGDFIISPQVENQNYFNFLPPSSNIVFPIVDNSTQTQNFCITANGVHPDLEVVISPIRAARPRIRFKI
ncbi:MAG: hypothetical protein IPP30_02730 [Flavobacterium sp.]|nr:hypothetical protein [Flavobacterium sp.]